jgi:hypothetical protein
VGLTNPGLSNLRLRFGVRSFTGLLERILTRVATGLFVTTTCEMTIVALSYFCHKVMEILVVVS